MDPATRASTRLTARLLCAGASLCAAAAAAQAPGGGVADPLPPAAPAAAAQPATGKAELAPVTITGNRPDDTAERRNSTASKIVIGRDEIDRFGDSTLGDVLKRLPGVTLQGRPGRGGAIAMRGLGNGYTQILLDGERVPPGFSLDSLTPDQIERIEILRAPTAETGARAIAGTINIVTRGGYSKRVNDVRVTALGLDLGAQALQPFDAPASERDPCAGAGEHARELGAEPARRSRDEGDAARQIDLVAHEFAQCLRSVESSMSLDAAHDEPAHETT